MLAVTFFLCNIGLLQLIEIQALCPQVARRTLNYGAHGACSVINLTLFALVPAAHWRVDESETARLRDRPYRSRLIALLPVLVNTTTCGALWLRISPVLKDSRIIGRGDTFMRSLVLAKWPQHSAKLHCPNCPIYCAEST